MAEDEYRGDPTMDRVVLERLDDTLSRALDHADDGEARFHLRQALQFVEIVEARDRNVEARDRTSDAR